MHSLSVIVLSGIFKNAIVFGLGLSRQSNALQAVLAHVILCLTSKGITGIKTSRNSWIGCKATEWFAPLQRL
jgi:hypothetical protein